MRAYSKSDQFAATNCELTTDYCITSNQLTVIARQRRNSSTDDPNEIRDISPQPHDKNVLAQPHVLSLKRARLYSTSQRAVDADG